MLVLQRNARTFCQLSLCSLILLGCSGTDAVVSLGNNATLSSLAVTGEALDPTFFPTVTSYSVLVINSTTSVTISAATTDSNASFTVNGSMNSAIELEEGDNTITIEVTAQDGVTKNVYLITVTRAPSVEIETVTGWDGQESPAPFFNFGDGAASEIHGQTFVVPSNAPILQQLSFWLQHSPDDQSGEDLFFSIGVIQWNVDRATGPVLFEGPIQRITAAQSTMSEYIVSTGGLVLEPGRKYVAFLSANNSFWDVRSTLVRVGFENSDRYSDGEAWTLDTDNDPDFITSQAWDNSFATFDFVFRLTF